MKWFSKKTEEEIKPEFRTLYQELKKIISQPIYYIRGHEIRTIEITKDKCYGINLAFVLEGRSKTPTLRKIEFAKDDYYGCWSYYDLSDVFLSREEAIAEIQRRCDQNIEELKNKS